MRSIRTAEEVLRYLRRTRRSGHTTCAIKGTRALVDSDNPVQAIVLASTLELIRDYPGERFITLSQIDRGAVEGLRDPLVIDHHAVEVLLSGLLQEIKERDTRIQNMGSKLETIEGILNR